MKMPIATSKSLDILLQYDVIFSDVYGVLHNSMNLLPNVLNTYRALIESKKKVVLISNAPRPSSVTRKKVDELGLEFLESIVTSGDLFQHYYSQRKDPLFNLPGYIHGYDINKDLTMGLNFSMTNNIEEAGFIMLVDYVEDQSQVELAEPLFKRAIALGLKAICPNPDKIVDNAGSSRYPSGAFAELYKRNGGEVLYFGKPYPEIFNFAKKKHMVSHNSKIIMIGDSMETDVLGANNIGIDSLLLLTGVTKNNDIHNYRYKPTYILETL